MRVELDPDNPEMWAELREERELTSGDIKSVRRVMRVTIDRDGNRTYSTAEEDEMADALLQRVVKNWSVPLPLPAEDPTSLDKLTPAAYEALKAAIDPYFRLVAGAGPSVKTSSGSSTG